MSLQPSFCLGLEVCLDDPPGVLRGARFGLLANQASVDHRFRYAWDVLAERFPGRLAAIFSPQHGLFGEEQANMIETGHSTHPRLGVPVHSLYSETRRPTVEMLDGLDALVVDLQDVGTRIYTFLWTVSHCLEACAAAGIPVVLLDRPNPLGGEIIEGPPLDPAFASFVGRAAIPMRHGLTLGELTRLVNEELSIGAELTVVPMQGWSRSMRFADTGREWLAPSPNLARLEAVAVYPGQVLLEGTNLSEGRGTTTPFELVGAPCIAPDALADALHSLNLDGVQFRPVRFRPTFDKWSGESCGGVFLHVTDAETFRPYRTTVAVLAAVKVLCSGPETRCRGTHRVSSEFRWLDPPYEYETERRPVDILSGSSRLRETIEAIEAIETVELKTIDALCRFDEAAWRRRTEAYRIYD
ncbi:MAG: exo-beta-N-acetylmuramidase NamZ family protein [Planctomycetaceae bacterium]